MKILLLLLLATACVKQKQQKAQATADEAITNISFEEKVEDSDTNFKPYSVLVKELGQTNVATTLGREWLEIWSEDEKFTCGDEDCPPYIFYEDNDLYPYYLGEDQQYKAEYEAFFQEQLELYGRNSRGERIVDSEKLGQMRSNYPHTY